MAFRNFAQSNDSAVAKRLRGPTREDGFPRATDWNTSPAIRFNKDWQGLNADTRRETQARLLWTPETLFLEFHARYRTITVFSDSEANGRRDRLWDRDVAEIFLQPEASDPLCYKEFEVSPNGMWIDLELSHGEKRDLESGLKCRATLDQEGENWRAELALPMTSLTRQFDPLALWRVNFFRVEGAAEPRFYSAWRPTRTLKPNFHVPAAFGKLLFAE